MGSLSIVDSNVTELEVSEETVPDSIRDVTIDESSVLLFGTELPEVHTVEGIGIEFSTELAS